MTFVMRVILKDSRATWLRARRPSLWCFSTTAVGQSASKAAMMLVEWAMQDWPAVLFGLVMVCVVVVVLLAGGIRYRMHSQTMILCPFHREKTPSCCVNVGSGRFYCFGCGRTGEINELFVFDPLLEWIDAV